MAYETYEPRPVPDAASAELRAFLEEELASIAYILNQLLQYVEDHP